MAPTAIRLHAPHLAARSPVLAALISPEPERGDRLSASLRQSPGDYFAYRYLARVAPARWIAVGADAITFNLTLIDDVAATRLIGALALAVLPDGERTLAEHDIYCYLTVCCDASGRVAVRDEVGFGLESLLLAEDQLSALPELLKEVHRERNLPFVPFWAAPQWPAPQAGLPLNQRDGHALGAERAHLPEYGTTPLEGGAPRVPTKPNAPR